MVQSCVTACLLCCLLLLLPKHRLPPHHRAFEQTSLSDYNALLCSFCSTDSCSFFSSQLNSHFLILQESEESCLAVIPICIYYIMSPAGNTLFFYWFLIYLSSIFLCKDKCSYDLNIYILISLLLTQKITHLRHGLHHAFPP